MKNLMTIALIAISITSLAACNNKIDTAEFSSEAEVQEKSALPSPNNKLNGKLVRLVYLHSGWFRPAGTPSGNRIEINFRADLGLVEFSQYDITDAKPEGILKCARTFVNEANYADIRMQSSQLSIGKSEGPHAVDIGNFQLQITDSSGYTLSGPLEASENLRAGAQAILNTQGLTTKILKLSQECLQGQGLKAIPVPTK